MRKEILETASMADSTMNGKAELDHKRRMVCGPLTRLLRLDSVPDCLAKYVGLKPILYSSILGKEVPNGVLSPWVKDCKKLGGHGHVDAHLIGHLVAYPTNMFPMPPVAKTLALLFQLCNCNGSRCMHDDVACTPRK